MLTSIAIEELSDTKPVLLKANSSTNFRGGFVVKVSADLPGSEPVPGGYAIAFGSTCPHMGCLVQKVDLENLVTQPCPCHGSTFDLAKSGLVVIGPATRNLPQLKLELSSNTLKVLKWLNDEVDPNSESWPCDSPPAAGSSGIA